MSDDLFERVARALERSLARDVEQDVYAGELTHEERVKVAQAAIAAIDLPGQREAAARAALEAAAREAWATRNGSVGMCDCEDCISQNIMHIDPAAFRGDDHATG